ncbi:gamma-glutamylcyclotransferase family protein [Lacisediminimonas profundi]|uniref:gamma-glutamylcyclotransferase family protein n=1 Tax=Lacisediminimonas profundi TaxID=2603856 RepID=UPI001387198E|nr:gamma-glutamylcyclotransferase family protein [Lacisediminimonas profundi]
MTHIFTYGSLMFPEVWAHVVQGRHAAQVASLAGFARHALHGQEYPGMVASRGDSVRGVLYSDVSTADVARLDRFEGDDYRRVQVVVAIENTRETVMASTYLYTGAGLLEDELWDPDTFLAGRFLQSNPLPEADR